MLCALVIGPELDVHAKLAQGDHGRDLYAAEAMLRAELPYRDYIWQYGPLMPFYYGLFAALFGVGAQSALFGAALLRAGTALTVFAILRRTTTPLIAVLGCWWLLLFHREFPHTFSHGGALLTLTVLTWLILRYIEEARPRDLLYGGAACFVLLLQKLNFGVIGLASLCAAVLFVELRVGCVGRSARMRAAVGIPIAALLAAMVYWWMLADLPEYAVRQSLPYLPNDSVKRLGLGEGVLELAQSYWRSLARDPHTVIGSLVIVAGLACWLPTLRRRGLLSNGSSIVLLTIGLLYGASLHEFVLSGFQYRLRWTDVFATLLTLLFAHELQLRVSLRARTALLAGLTLFCLGSTATRWASVAEAHTPEQRLDHDRLDIYTGNEPGWREVVLETAAYLEEHVAPDERFFAIPYEAIYYFLASQPSPTRSLMLFEFMGISEQQEANIIEDLERENVRWIVVSNRAWSSEEVGIGVFGETHARRLATWIEEEFEVVQEIGPQDDEARWIEVHATRILRRREGAP